MKIDKGPDLPYSPPPPPPIDCCVRINHKPDSSLLGDIQSWVIWFLDSDCIDFKTFVFLVVYWSIWTLLYNTDIKFLNFYSNGASTMLNNVFKIVLIVPKLAWSWKERRHSKNATHPWILDHSLMLNGMRSSNWHLGYLHHKFERSAVNKKHCCFCRSFMISLDSGIFFCFSVLIF